MLLICSYLDQEFVRIGYYIDNDFEDEALRENPPANTLDPQVLAILKRNILVDKPRVTRFNIKWDPSKLDEAEDISELINLKVEEDSSEADDSWSDSATEEEAESNTSMEEEGPSLKSENNMMDVEDSITC